MIRLRLGMNPDMCSLYTLPNEERGGVNDDYCEASIDAQSLLVSGHTVTRKECRGCGVEKGRQKSVE